MKIAIIDSGVYADHPHVGGIAGGIALVGDDLLDRLGHGTAIAGAIREKVPQAEIYAVKVFDRRLSCSLEAIFRALEWCVENQMDIINLSVGVRKEVAKIPGLPIVVTVPGVFPGAITVRADENCPRDVFYYRDGIFYASPYPRPIPGVPAERNLNGASFAVANMTGFVARALAESPAEAIRPALIAKAASNP
ncbi:MAG TPA: S8 family serine peptidase [Bryobacteraceae bacterium]|nr:S8 family serine peptidase [Bryobacteraceae bacterium]